MVQTGHRILEPALPVAQQPHLQSVEVRGKKKREREREDRKVERLEGWEAGREGRDRGVSER